jgi:hypothetical protein
MLLSFHVNLSFSGTVVLLQKIFEKCCVYETQMPPRVTNSIESHAYIKAFETRGPGATSLT